MADVALTINNVLATAIGYGPTVSNPAGAKGRDRFEADSADKPEPVGPAQTETTDNITADSEPASSEPEQRFKSVLEQQNSDAQPPQDTRDSVDEGPSQTNGGADQNEPTPLTQPGSPTPVSQLLEAAALGTETAAANAQPEGTEPPARNAAVENAVALPDVVAQALGQTTEKVGQIVSAAMQAKQQPSSQPQNSEPNSPSGGPAGPQGGEVPKATLPDTASDVALLATEQTGQKGQIIAEAAKQQAASNAGMDQQNAAKLTSAPPPANPTGEITGQAGDQTPALGKNTLAESPVTVNTQIPDQADKPPTQQQPDAGAGAKYNQAGSQTAQTQVISGLKQSGVTTSQPGGQSTGPETGTGESSDLDIEVSSGQTNTVKADAQGNNPAILQDIPFDSSSRADLADRPPIVSATGNTTDVPQSNTPADLTQQLQNSVYAALGAGGRQIIVRLNPPELGSVVIKFEQQDGQITGLLEVEKAQTKAQVEQALPQILQNLADSGISVKRIQVNLSQSELSEQNSFKQGLTGSDDPAGQDGLTGGEYPDGTPQQDYQWSSGTDSYSQYMDSADMFISDNSINVLI